MSQRLDSAAAIESTNGHDPGQGTLSFDQPRMAGGPLPCMPRRRPARGEKNYREASHELKQVGTAHAEGDALRAMYAQLLAARMRGADPARFYAYLKTNDDLIGRFKRLCDDVWAYTDALLTDP